MSEKSRGSSYSSDPTEAVKSAHSSKGPKTAAKGKSEAPSASEEKASQAPEHKGAKNQYGGPWRADHPSSDPAPHATPFDSSTSELDGHAPKKPSQRK
jgi:hypothetical protein